VKNVRTYHRVDTLSPRRTRIQKIRRSAALEWNRIEVTREIWGVRQRQQEHVQVIFGIMHLGLARPNDSLIMLS